MGLVYEQVILNGRIEEMESAILEILEERTNKILDRDRNVLLFSCPVCKQSCDNIVNLIKHLIMKHMDNVEQVKTNTTKSKN